MELPSTCRAAPSPLVTPFPAPQPPRPTPWPTHAPVPNMQRMPEPAPTPVPSPLPRRRPPCAPPCTLAPPHAPAHAMALSCRGGSHPHLRRLALSRPRPLAPRPTPSEPPAQRQAQPTCPGRSPAPTRLALILEPIPHRSPAPAPLPTLAHTGQLNRSVQPSRAPVKLGAGVLWRASCRRAS